MTIARAFTQRPHATSARRKLRASLATSAAALGLALAVAPASAGETITYSYDAQGRLVKVARSGTINNGTSACYSYDPADNRSNVTVNTASACSAAAPAVTFSVNSASVREGSSLVFTVTKSGTAAGTTTIDYATVDGTATAGSDYTAKTGTLSFTAFQASQTVSVATIDDTAVESSETVLLNLSNPTGGAAVATGQGVGTILDDESDCAGVTFTIASNGAVTEGGSSVFTVTKAGTASYSCSVSYATLSGAAPYGAVSGSDFTATSGTLTFTSAQTSRTVSVPTIDDTVQESAETFWMSLSSPDKGGALGTPSMASATINDNDACAGVSFTVASNGPVTEGAGSTFTITKTGTTSYACSVSYATADGTAVAPGDYISSSGSVTLAPTETSASVIVATNTDALTEGAETFTLSLLNPTDGATLGTASSATGTINDGAGGGVCSGVSFSVNDVSAKEGVALKFIVSKAGTTSSSCTVNYATANGTAVAPADYAATSGTLTFTSAATSQTVSVTTVNNAMPVGTSVDMYLNLSGASSGAGISDAQGIGTINGSDSGCITCLQSTDPGTTDPGSLDAVPPPADPPPADPNSTSNTDPPPTPE